MNRLLILTLFVLMVFVATTTTAIVLTPEQAVNTPSIYATVVDGKVVHDAIPTAYSSVTFNKILTSYGIELDKSKIGDVPSSYAKISGDVIVFNGSPMAYDPPGYHKIFTSYGLILNPDKVSQVPSSYAKVVDGEVVFGSGVIAYDNLGFAAILSAYELPEVVAAPPVVVEQETKWVLNTGYMFDFDKAVIRPHYYVLLDYVIEAMTEKPELRFEIQGHTCDLGSVEYNQGLSERRAYAIYDYFVSNGIDASRLTAVGFGELSPAYPNDGEENRSKNRRVELLEF